MKTKPKIAPKVELADKILVNFSGIRYHVPSMGWFRIKQNDKKTNKKV